MGLGDVVFLDLIHQNGSTFCLSCIHLLISGCLGSEIVSVCQEEEKNLKLNGISFHKIYLKDKLPLCVLVLCLLT